MPYRDKERQRAYQREWQRARKAGQPTRTIARTLNLTYEEIRTASALLTVLTGLIGQVLSSKQGDIFLKARTAGYLISIGLRAVEVVDLEARIAALEEKVGVKP